MSQPDYTIVVDTRERLPYNFYGCDVVHKKLDVGDYSIEGFEDTFAVERKSMDDLAQTLGRGHSRFVREMNRGVDMDRIVVVIEGNYSDVAAYRDTPGKKVPRDVYYAHTHPNTILGTVEKWPRKYPNLSFVWAGDRTGGKALTLDLLFKWANERTPL